MEIFNIVPSTAEAAFATDGKNSIVAWNKAAEQLLGYEESRILGKSCSRVLRGTDLFGNRFCDKNCPLAKMARLREGVCDFDMDVRRATSNIIRTRISIIVVPGWKPSEFLLIHLLKPLEHLKSEKGGKSGKLECIIRSGSHEIQNCLQVLRLEFDLLREDQTAVPNYPRIFDCIEGINKTIQDFREHFNWPGAVKARKRADQAES